MATYIKTHVKDFNGDLLAQQIKGILPEANLLWAGFRLNDHQLSLYGPNAGTEVIATQSQPDGSTLETTAEPGEMMWRFPHSLTPDQEASFDAILIAHDATQLSTSQTNKKADTDAVPILVQTYQDWATLTNTQKDNRTRELFRLMARVIDATTDL